MYTLDPAKAAHVLSHSVSSVFAETAFIDVSEVTGSRDLPAHEQGELRRSLIDVLTPLSCSIGMKISTVIRDRILDTLFTECPEHERKKNAEDALLEILNIIAGTFLSAYFGPGTEIQLSLPRYLYLNEEEPGQEITRLFLDAEGEILEVSLHSIRYRY